MWQMTQSRISKIDRAKNRFPRSNCGDRGQITFILMGRIRPGTFIHMIYEWSDACQSPPTSHDRDHRDRLKPGYGCRLPTFMGGVQEEVDHAPPQYPESEFAEAGAWGVRTITVVWRPQAEPHAIGDYAGHCSSGVRQTTSSIGRAADGSPRSVEPAQEGSTGLGGKRAEARGRKSLLIGRPQKTSS